MQTLAGDDGVGRVRLNVAAVPNAVDFLVAHARHHGLAHARAVHRAAHADAREHADSALLNVHLVHVYNVCALGYDQMDGLVYLTGQRLHGCACDLYEVEIFHHLTGQRIELGGHAVSSALLILAHVAACRHGREHTVHRALVQTGALGQLVNGQAIACPAQLFHDIKCTIERLHRSFFRHFRPLRFIL